jgi:hypothetical protein
MLKKPAIVLAWCLFLTTCNRSRSLPPDPPRGAASPAVPGTAQLPAAISNFSAGPLETEGGGVRRQYRRDSTRITVTLAQLPMTAEQYDEWVKTSTRSFPQAAIDVGPARGNGFYQCEARGRCDLLIQLRSGVHLELRGGGTATRDDVNAIARELPLRALAEEAATAGPHPTEVSFRHEVAPVLAASCAASDGCHGADPTHRVHMDLREKTAYLSLVGRPSELRAGAVLVDPGHPVKSFMVDKLTRNLAPKGEGRPMPLDPQTGNVVDPNPVERFVWKTLVAWIAQGAQNN